MLNASGLCRPATPAHIPPQNGKLAVSGGRLGKITEDGCPDSAFEVLNIAFPALTSGIHHASHHGGEIAGRDVWPCQLRHVVSPDDFDNHGLELVQLRHFGTKRRPAL